MNFWCPGHTDFEVGKSNLVLGMADAAGDLQDRVCKYVTCMIVCSTPCIHPPSHEGCSQALLSKAGLT